MNKRIERIPVPAAQRWENLREGVLPLVCLAATITACGWMWQQQGRMAPFVHGEVGAEVVAVRSPIDGRLLPIETQPVGQWPLFAKIAAGATAARLERLEGEATVIELPAPIEGVVTKVLGLPGQWVGRSETILEIASTKPTFITCHLPDVGAPPPKLGSEVAIRLRGNGNRWAAARIQGVGPVVATATVFDGTSVGATIRGLPVRIELPADLPLKPGTLVDVRFPPAPL
jgi:hypothetical protein